MLKDFCQFYVYIYIYIVCELCITYKMNDSFFCEATYQKYMTEKLMRTNKN